MYKSFCLAVFKAGMGTVDLPLIVKVSIHMLPENMVIV